MKTHRNERHLEPGNPSAHPNRTAADRVASETDDRAAASRITQGMLLGVCVLLFLAGIVVRNTAFLDPGGRKFTSDTFFKVGFVVGLAWLASPQLEKLGWQKLRGTGLAVICLIGAMTAVRPRFGAIAAGILIGGFLVLAVLGWVRGVIFNGRASATTIEKHGKIEKNPTKR